MRKRKWIGFLLAVLLIMISQPVLAEAPSDPASKPVRSEVFINSNALNSMVTILSEEEVVSGPGNKVLANLPAGSVFEVALDPAEGSQVLAFSIRLQNIETGEVSELSPSGQREGRSYYQIPETGAFRVFGEVYFGDPVEISTEAAEASVEEAMTAHLQSETRVLGESFEAAAQTGHETEQDSISDVANVSSPGPNPATGHPHPDVLLACAILSLLVAAVTLWMQKAS